MDRWRGRMKRENSMDGWMDGERKFDGWIKHE
jgi:hypothetical protein